MNLRDHFEYRPFLDLTAANIGINKWHWVSVSVEDETEAKRIMQTNRFDVLPIINHDDSITKYYSTRVWNTYNNLNLNTIAETDKVYYRLSFCDLIRKFSEEKKHYYFLTDYNRTVGLVSFVNLNCQAVYNYLFQVIADIERSISCFLKIHIQHDEILESFRSSGDSHVKQLLEGFNQSISEGSDNSIYEHMYFQTIGITIKKHLHKLPYRQRELGSYQSKFSPNGTYGILRNKIMHPVRPILSNPESISQINELLQDYSAIREILL
jgi:hypothetical protein